MHGVNAELYPLVRMTAPEAWSTRSILDWPVGQRLFRSWILFLGLLPVDRHDFRLKAIRPGQGFSEHSTSLVNALWRHERTVVARASGCQVTDVVSYQSRLPLVGLAFEPVYRLVFWWRHRKLRTKFHGRDN